jgi:large conductance mechanosensitive channel
MNKINELTKRRASIEEPEDEPLPADTALLVEIRDLLTELAAANKSNENAR